MARLYDGWVFDHRTTDHELPFKEDAAIIASLAPSYRISLMWSKLQHAPFASTAVSEYRAFLDDLKARGVSIMMVLHHSPIHCGSLHQLNRVKFACNCCYRSDHAVK